MIFTNAVAVIIQKRTILRKLSVMLLVSGK